jgi:cold shock CspA family protein
MKHIDSNFCLDLRVNKLNADLSNKALRLYSSLFEEAVQLQGKLPIVIDTNILLGYYGMSQSEKNKLFKFFEEFGDRIILTRQVEQEYLRNRLSVIKKEFFTPLTKITEDYRALCADVEGKIQSFRESKKKLLSQDFPEFWDKIREKEEEIIGVLNDIEFVSNIEERINETTQNNKNIVLEDLILEKVSTFKILPELSKEEKDFLNNLYDEQIQVYKSSKENLKWQYAIPGCGENKEEPTGDFFIFHEILKYMEDNKTSCIFLTNDVTKGDWLQPDKNAFNHYIEQSYLLTKHVLIIVHAEKTLPSISFENIHKEKNTVSIINDPLNNFIDTQRESYIVSIDKHRGFGFIQNKGGNLYFNHLDVTDGQFSEMEMYDIVEYKLAHNIQDEEVAICVKKMNYSFDNSHFEIQTSIIANINIDKGFGFILHEPENLYFHQSFLQGDFKDLRLGDEIEFIKGKNADGNDIARIVRRKNASR